MKIRSLMLVLCAIAFVGMTRAEDLKPAANDDGFRAMFNGKDLTGWDGSPANWSVKDGLIVGETTDATALKNANSFLIAKDGDKDLIVGDFEFRVSFRFDAGHNFGNSGIQYRSHRLPDNGPNKWRVGGYQADCEAAKTYPGILYEEGGRGILVNRGEKLHIAPDGKKESAETEPKDEVNKAVKDKGEWNDYVVIAKGNHLVQILNGHVTVDLIDEEAGKAAANGILALQLHAGAPMKIEFKNPRIKTGELEKK